MSPMMPSNVESGGVNGIVASRGMFERESSLCFNSVDFERESFDADAFVSSHGRLMDLDSLLAPCAGKSFNCLDDLRSFHHKTKQSLIELINSDYSDFVSLSQTLGSVQPIVDRVEAPLTKWNSQLGTMKSQMTQLDSRAQSILLEKRGLSVRKQQLLALKALHTTLAFLESALFDASGKKQTLSLDQLGSVKRVSLQLSSLNSQLAGCDMGTVSETVLKRVDLVQQHFLDQLGLCLCLSVSSHNQQAFLSLLQIYSTVEKMPAAYQVFRSKFVEPYVKEAIASSVALSVSQENVSKLFLQILDFFPQRALFVAQALNAQPEWRGRFHYEVEAVFAEVVEQLVKGCSQLFMPVNWRQMAMCHRSCLEFLGELERTVLHSGEQVRHLRQSSHYRRLSDKWSLPVYFQLVFQEVVSRVEQVIEPPPISHNNQLKVSPFLYNDAETRNSEDSQSSSSNGSSSCVLVVSQEVSDCLSLCWSEQEAYLSALCHKFVKLTLQLCIRFVTWVESAPSDFEKFKKQQEVELLSAATLSSDAIGSSEQVQQNTNMITTSSLNSVGQHSKEKTSREVECLDTLIMCLMADCGFVLSHLQTLWDLRIYREIKQVQQLSTSATVHKNSVGTPFQSIKNLIKQQLDNLTKQAVAASVEQLKKVMKPISETPRLFRKTNRGAPEKESSYMVNVVSKLDALTVGCKLWTRLSMESKSSILTEVAMQLCEYMRKQVSDICASVEKIEHSLKKIRSSKSMKGSASQAMLGDTSQSAPQSLSDSEKIYLQLYLDVHCLILHLRTLIKRNSSPTYNEEDINDQLQVCNSLAAQIEFASAYKLRNNPL